MTFISHQNRRPFIWLRWSLLVFFVLIFFILGGSSLIVRGALLVSKITSFSNSTVPLEQIAALQAKIADLEAERDHLSALLGDRGTLQKTTPAHVSLSGGYLFADSIVIDKGTNDGVVINDYVTTVDGMFVGPVVDAKSSWSRVAPFTQLGRKTVIRGGKNKEIIFEVNGIGGSEAEVDLPVSTDVKVGDVFWSGEYPDLVIGVVDRIDQSPARQIKTVSFRPPFAFKFLTIVDLHKKNI